jgi:hypothetical protein
MTCPQFYLSSVAEKNSFAKYFTAVKNDPFKSLYVIVWEGWIQSPIATEFINAAAI